MRWCHKCSGAGVRKDYDGDGYTVYRICTHCHGHREEPKPTGSNTQPRKGTRWTTK